MLRGERAANGVAPENVACEPNSRSIRINSEGADLVIEWDLTLYPEADRARAIPLTPVAFGPVRALGNSRSATKGTRIAHDFTSSAT
ncbi:MAG TPA: hypothetical protein VF534_16890 [Paraburkholderia sp.]